MVHIPNNSTQLQHTEVCCKTPWVLAFTHLGTTTTQCKHGHAPFTWDISLATDSKGLHTACLLAEFSAGLFSTHLGIRVLDCSHGVTHCKSSANLGGHQFFKGPCRQQYVSLISHERWN